MGGLKWGGALIMAVLFALLLGAACSSQLGAAKSSQQDAASWAAVQTRLAGGLPRWTAAVRWCCPACAAALPPLPVHHPAAAMQPSLKQAATCPTYCLRSLACHRLHRRRRQLGCRL